LPVNDAILGGEKKKRGVPPLAVAIVLVAILGGVGFWYLDRASKAPPPGPPALTPEARAYTSHLALSGVAMQAHTSYLNQQIVEITGNVQNTGDRKLALVEINCIFYDPYGKVLLRQRVPIVSRKMGSLAPGETKAFRLPFDDIPEGWNQDTPQLVIAQIQFE
jgi:hypothetical protein